LLEGYRRDVGIIPAATVDRKYIIVNDIGGTEPPRRQPGMFQKKRGIDPPSVNINLVVMRFFVPLQKDG
jgi:hypothetical protein